MKPRECIWCEKVVDPYGCPKCRKSFPNICFICHRHVAHHYPVSDEEEGRYVLRGTPTFLSGKDCSVARQSQFKDYQDDEDMNRRTGSINEYTGGEI